MDWFQNSKLFRRFSFYAQLSWFYAQLRLVYAQLRLVYAQLAKNSKKAGPLSGPAVTFQHPDSSGPALRVISQPSCMAKNAISLVRLMPFRAKRALRFSNYLLKKLAV